MTSTQKQLALIACAVVATAMLMLAFKKKAPNSNPVRVQAAARESAIAGVSDATRSRTHTGQPTAKRQPLGPQMGALFETQPATPVTPAAQPLAHAVTTAAPTIPYRYAGRTVSEGRQMVFVLSGNHAIPVAIGQMLENELRVEAISDEGISLHHLPTSARHLLPSSRDVGY